MRTLAKRGKNSFDIRESQRYLSIHPQHARTVAGGQATLTCLPESILANKIQVLKLVLCPVHRHAGAQQIKRDY